VRLLGKVPLERREAALSSVENEIRGERARALGRTVRRLEEALASLEGAAAAHRRGRPSRDELVEDAAERLWYAVVQREAVGLRRHDEFLRDLRVPAEVATRMGPRRRRR
jgi:hypothetical protein